MMASHTLQILLLMLAKRFNIKLWIHLPMIISKFQNSKAKLTKSYSRGPCRIAKHSHWETSSSQALWCVATTKTINYNICWQPWGRWEWRNDGREHVQVPLEQMFIRWWPCYCCNRCYWNWCKKSKFKCNLVCRVLSDSPQWYFPNHSIRMRVHSSK